MQIPVEEICEKILHGTVLDVFFCISKEKLIHKRGIAEKFIASDENEKSQFSTYRPVIDVAIAKLQGGMLIDSYPEKTKDIYYVTAYGEVAKHYMQRIFSNDDPTRLHGTIILKKLLEGSKNHGEE